MDSRYTETIRACLVPNPSKEGLDPERRGDENVGGGNSAVVSPGWRGNRMKTSENENKRLARTAQKFARQCIQFGGFPTSYSVAAIRRHLHPRRAPWKNSSTLSYYLMRNSTSWPLAGAAAATKTHKKTHKPAWSTETPPTSDATSSGSSTNLLGTNLLGKGEMRGRTASP